MHVGLAIDIAEHFDATHMLVHRKLIKQIPEDPLVIGY